MNFPDCNLPRQGIARLTLIHANIKSILNKITQKISDSELNISNLLNKNNGEYAYTVIDIDSDVESTVIDGLKEIEGMIRVRIIR